MIMPITPDEIRATLSSAAHYPHNRIWVVFQPHTYSRTKLLFNEFADALSHADKVVLAKIYPQERLIRLESALLTCARRLNLSVRNVYTLTILRTLKNIY